MKKIGILVVFAAAITLISCGSSGWKCTNKYGNVPQKHIKPNKK